MNLLSERASIANPQLVSSIPGIALIPSSAHVAAARAVCQASVANVRAHTLKLGRGNR